MKSIYYFTVLQLLLIYEFAFFLSRVKHHKMDNYSYNSNVFSWELKSACFFQAFTTVVIPVAYNLTMYSTSCINKNTYSSTSKLCCANLIILS